MIKVLILTEGGGSWGWGHVTRCAAIAQGLDERGCEWDAVVNAQGNLPSDASGKKWSRSDWRKLDDQLTARVTASDYVIVDSYQASADVYQRICSLNKNLIVIDDNDRITYPPCILVNPNVYGDQMAYSDRYEVWAGARYMLLREPFWDVPERTGGAVSGILLMLGGGNSSGLKKEILKFLADQYPQLKKYVVVCGAETSQEEIRKEGDSQTLFLKDLDAGAVRDVMARSDFAISAGGQTLGELARMAVPAIAVSVAENQDRNVAAWQAKGFVRGMDQKDSAGIQRAVGESVEFLKSLPSGRPILSSIDGQGVRRFVENLICRRWLSLRRATLDDCADLWKWRNDPSVRGVSFQQEEIPLESHRQWFESKLKDAGVAIYVCEYERGQKAGQARFEMIDGGSALIHMNLNPDFIGRGFGSYVIAQATRTLMKEYPHIAFVKAEVFAGNFPSQKAFQKAGYAQQGEERRSGRDFKIFVFKQ